MKLAGKLVKYNTSFSRNDDDDFEDLPEFGCDLEHATPKSVEGMQNTPIEGMQSTPVDRRTRSHSGTPSDRVTRSQTIQRVVVEKGTSSKRKIKMVGKNVVKDKGKCSKRKAKRDEDGGDRKDEDHHDSHGHHDTGDIHNDYFGDKEVVENTFGSEKVMEKNIGSEEVVKKKVGTEVSLEQTVDVMVGVVKDYIEAGKSSEGVGDDEARIEDAEPEITAITQKFCDKNDVDGDSVFNIAEVKKNTANMGGLVEDFVQVVGKNSCEEVGVEKNIATMQEDHIVVVDHDTPEMISRERKPAWVMKSPCKNIFDSGGTIQVAQNRPTKSKKPILTNKPNKSIFTINYHFQENIDNPVDFRILFQSSIELYSVLLPYFLHRIGFGNIKENHMGIPTTDHFEIHVVDGLPTQDNRLKDLTEKDNKKKGKSHAVSDDKALKDNKKKGKTHAVGDDETLKDIKKKGKLKGKMFEMLMLNITFNFNLFVFELIVKF
ncbi:hypothetical protein A4A49_01707 [Nicotiana attenuata]|uniref:Uncharacterized protein n=1 Tax=Nicotiana attenuata TaxID=49451 RepID=A0A1J6J2R5_NICAT|nr:hypothetical protein A4A49_01707 [Nicotiana attenuata]